MFVHVQQKECKDTNNSIISHTKCKHLTVLNYIELGIWSMIHDSRFKELLHDIAWLKLIKHVNHGSSSSSASAPTLDDTTKTHWAVHGSCDGEEFWHRSRWIIAGHLRYLTESTRQIQTRFLHKDCFFYPPNVGFQRKTLRNNQSCFQTSSKITPGSFPFLIKTALKKHFKDSNRRSFHQALFSYGRGSGGWRCGYTWASQLMTKISVIIGIKIIEPLIGILISWLMK